MPPQVRRGKLGSGWARSCCGDFATDSSGDDRCALALLETITAAKYSGIPNTTGKLDSRTASPAWRSPRCRPESATASRSEHAGIVLPWRSERVAATYETLQRSPIECAGTPQGTPVPQMKSLFDSNRPLLPDRFVAENSKPKSIKPDDR